VTGAVGCGTGAGSLTAFTKVFRLAAEGALVDTAFFSAGKGQAHMLQLEDGFRPYRAHIFNGILVADVVGALDGVIHMPLPLILRIIAGDGAGDAALGGYSV